MTEAEWLGHAVPGLMLRFLGDGASERKLRLFACNCAELVWRSMLSLEVPEALGLAWGACDGSVRQPELLPAANGTADAQSATGRGSVEWWAGQVLEGVFRPPTRSGLAQTRSAVEALAVQRATIDRQDTARASQEARTAVASLLRDIFGNPFRRFTFDPVWCSGSAVALARQMYESHEFGTMPILADALQDAGCEDADILDHCRGRGSHVRGCWVVDLVLGRE